MHSTSHDPNFHDNNSREGLPGSPGSTKTASVEERALISQAVEFDRLKAAYIEECAEREFRERLPELRTRWCARFPSAATQRTYDRALRDLFTWLGARSLRTLAPEGAEAYLIYCTARRHSITGKHISRATVRLSLAAAGSFCTTLVRFGYLPRNPFQGIRIPRLPQVSAAPERIPSEEELDLLEKYARDMGDAQADNPTNTRRRQEAGRAAYAAIKLLRAEGLRIGALQGLIIDPQGHYRTTSKGYVVEGVLSTELLAIFDACGLTLSCPFAYYTPGAFTTWLARASRRLLGRCVRPHALRHRFSLTHYERHRDPMRLMQKLGHHTLASTEVYLRALTPRA